MAMVQRPGRGRRAERASEGRGAAGERDAAGASPPPHPAGPRPDTGDPDGGARDRRAMIGDGVSFSLMVGLGESYLAAFVLAAGLGEVTAGLATSVPMLAGAILQMISPAAVRRLRSHRRWVVLCALLQAASFLPLVAAAAAGSVSRALVFAAAGAYWGFGFATGPAWNTWVETLVPPDERARFFARRARWSQAAVLLGVVAGGALLHACATHPAAAPGADAPTVADPSLWVFGVLFAAAALARLVSARFLASQREPVPLPPGHRHVSMREFLHRVGGGDGRLLRYLLAMQVSVHLAAAYFTPYLLGPLQLSYGQFTALTAVAFAARIAALPLLGRLAHRYGARRLLWAGAIGIAPLPALWLVSQDVRPFLAIQVMGGIAWGALELAILLSFFEHIPASERTGVLTCFNLANALAIAGGAAIGGLAFDALGGGHAGYAVLFLASAAARGAALWALRGVGEVPVPEAPLQLRTVAVRPNAGALQRPILPTATAEED